LAHRAAGEVLSQEAPDLGDDLVRLVVRDAKAAVALQIELVEPGAWRRRISEIDAARGDRHAGVTAPRDAEARELADQAVAAAVRGLTHQHAAESLGIGRLAKQEPRLVGCPAAMPETKYSSMM